MRLQRLPRIVKAKRFWWLIALAFLIVSVVLLARYPRNVLLSDVRQARKIIVNWHQSQNDDRYTAFELNALDRERFLRELTENLDVDYLNAMSRAPPMVGLHLANDDGECVAYYVIVRAWGGNRCPSMESLRELASKGRPLSRPEIDELFNDKLRPKWPHILPWPECRFEYVLPAVRTTEE